MDDAVRSYFMYIESNTNYLTDDELYIFKQLDEAFRTDTCKDDDYLYIGILAGRINLRKDNGN